MNDFSIYCPISKVNEEKRTVAGWATTEEVDKQGEVVDFNGSKEAFGSWGKNIREMHEPKAVGKAVEIIPDDATKKVWVEAYISKGAEDTWQKVKEGVLTGFSIGGQTVHKNVQIIKDMATGGSRTVTRITKYRLNELSLVDNPANPGCSFELVKSVDGVPFQTEIVEDSKKLLITEAEDPLTNEVHIHRDKADSLSKKVLDREDLDGLSDDSFGVIRKYQKGDTLIKERLLPMSDKVHAVTALAILEKYNLSPDEIEAVHKKAQAILGSAYQSHNVTNRGGENEMDVTKLTEVIESLVKRFEELEKAFEGAYRPVAGSKETPKEPCVTPELGESTAEKRAPTDAELGDLVTATAANESDTEKGIAGVATRIAGKVKEYAPKVIDAARSFSVKHPAAVGLGAVSALGAAGGAGAGAITAGKGNRRKGALAGGVAGIGTGIIGGGITGAIVGHANRKTNKMTDVIQEKGLSEADLEKLYEGFIELEDEMEKAMAGATTGNITDAPEVKPSAVEESGDPAKVMPEVKTHDATEVVKALPPELAAAIEAKKEDPKEEAAETPAEEAAEPKEEVVETEEEKKKRELAELEAKKLADAKSEQDLVKVTNELETLRKRFDAVTELLKKPMPRKHIIEKNVDTTHNDDSQFQSQRAEVLKWIASGKPLTAEQEKVREDVLNKSMDSKFGKAL